MRHRTSFGAHARRRLFALLLVRRRRRSFVAAIRVYYISMTSVWVPVRAILSVQLRVQFSSFYNFFLFLLGYFFATRRRRFDALLLRPRAGVIVFIEPFSVHSSRPSWSSHFPHLNVRHASGISQRVQPAGDGAIRSYPSRSRKHHRDDFLIVVPPKGLPFPEETHKIVRIFVVFKSFSPTGRGERRKRKRQKERAKNKRDLVTMVVVVSSFSCFFSLSLSLFRVDDDYVKMMCLENLSLVLARKKFENTSQRV